MIRYNSTLPLTVGTITTDEGPISGLTTTSGNITLTTTNGTITVDQAVTASTGGGVTYLQSGGDLITAIDGQPVDTFDDIMVYLENYMSPGDKVTLEMSPYNLTKGRINFRHKDERPPASASRPNFFRRR